MTANIQVDDQLLAEAMKLGGFASKKDAVIEALREFVRRRLQLKAIELFGKCDWDPDI